MSNTFEHRNEKAETEYHAVTLLAQFYGFFFSSAPTPHAEAFSKEYVFFGCIIHDDLIPYV